SLAASAVESIRAEERRAVAGSGRAAAPSPPTPGRSATGSTHVRFFPVDGSTFLDGDYLIKGVAGRLLWKLISDYSSTGRTSFTNREAKLDPVLGLPPYRDNFESRLVLLKRRLDEREAPLRIVSAGRGRFELRVLGAVRLDYVET
ncbi:MAG TPA: hypothetical protein VHQ23_14500, partial [Ilumatobacteraceae bacterium]|nr:hypothetical protein [Ilumatobacteraceae bacterium]